jgi:hypothetical protein
MSEALYPARDPLHVAYRRLWAAVGISVLLHLALVLKIPQVATLRPADEAKERGPLIVQLTPPPGAPTPRLREPVPRAREPAARPKPPPAPRPVEKAPERSRPSVPAPPPVIARAVPSPDAPTVPRETPPQAAAQPTPPRAAGDLAAYVEARRRARGEAPAPPAPPPVARSTPAEDENARANRIARANLGLDRPPRFGTVMREGGGVFRIDRKVSHYAEYTFYGWNPHMERHVPTKYEVPKGVERNIEIALVRHMIELIRQQEPGDFEWESHRLGRTLMLSARPRDQAGLEDFLMQEFFEEPRRPAFAR